LMRFMTPIGSLLHYLTSLRGFLARWNAQPAVSTIRKPLTSWKFVVLLVGLLREFVAVLLERAR
jgi:hypothetical protein